MGRIRQISLGVGVWLWAMAGPLHAQLGGLDRSAVVIDAAHGGAETGAQIAEQVPEKDVTLAIAQRLKTLLAARGFHVVMTRDGDGDGGSLDQRAEAANRSRAIACLVLHASSSTKGVLVGTSALKSAVMRAASPSTNGTQTSIPWSRAQEAYVAQSGLLANQIGTGLTRSGIAATMMRVMMRPLDNLTCPAVSIEMGVLPEEGATPTPVTDERYQQRVAEAIAASLQQWRTQAEPVDSTRGAAL